jgi:serine/threonine-protein phosphatase 2A activator
VVERERNTNMYFSAIGFIRDVKSGPFWEHSPMLYDISGIRAGWGKINKVRTEAAVQVLFDGDMLISIIGYDQNVQCGSTFKIPSCPTFPFRFVI